MLQLLRLLALFTADPATTDDAWDCAPWYITLPDGTTCDLNDPLGCIPAESDATP